MKKLLILFVFATSAIPPLHAQSVAEVIAAGELKTVDYRERFRDLLADELKTFEEFDKKGNPKDKTTVLSSFLVYRSGKTASPSAELRNVREVNGKPVPDSQLRGQQFLAELERESTPESELKKLEAQSSKFDTTWSVYGLTLNQAVALSPNLRPSFSFSSAADEKINEFDCHVVTYEQTAPSKYIVVNGKTPPTGELSVGFTIDLPRELKKTELFLRGRLWLDKSTSRVIREERELVARTAIPLVLLRTTFDFAPSAFDVFLPKTVVTEVFNVRQKNGLTTSTLRTRFSLVYSNYRRTDVEVRILDEETSQP